jgi:hypothetical protein
MKSKEIIGKSGLTLLAIILVQACLEKKMEVSYFDTGKVKEKAETVNGKRNGNSWEYDSAGNLLSMRSWRNGILDGQFEVFYLGGALSRKGKFRMGKPVEMTTYFRSGKIKALYYYDEMGEVVEVKSFLEDGTQDLAAFPYMNFIPRGDTIRLGSKVTFRVRMVNIYDSIYFNGRMIITSKLTPRSTTEITRVQDTLALIYPTDQLTYLYTFTTKGVGQDSIKGQLLFEKDLGDELKFRTEVFAYPFYVVE